MRVNIDSSILDEPLMYNLERIKKVRVKILMNNYDIKTVEDFLNADIASMFNSVNVIRQLVGLQRVLNYKYKRRRTTPQDIYLEEVYYPGQAYRNKNIEILEKLGFAATSGIFTKADELASADPENLPKIIDVIRYISTRTDNEYTSLLATFYSKYYDTVKKRQISKITPETLNDIKMELNELKAEIDAMQSIYKRLNKVVKDLEKGTSKNEK